MRVNGDSYFVPFQIDLSIPSGYNDYTNNSLFYFFNGRWCTVGSMPAIDLEGLTHFLVDCYFSDEGCTDLYK